ncbi:MAG: hypothetical protein JNM95_13525, partial [Chitinophagaceae bacterium]|nr:hypothetical protein [Chitinophagaceae bacterium]
TYFIFAHDNGTGCYSSIGVPVSVFVNPLPILGTTTGSVSGNGCLGESINCTYNPVVCGTSTDFQDYYAPANWNLALTNSNGSVITTSAPSSITMVSSNGIGSTSGNTAYSITIPCTGNISFNWDYTTVDGAFYDYPAYQINGGTLTALPGFNFGLGSLPQNGTFTLAVNAGDVFTIDAYSVDNFAGSCNVVLSSFVAPVSLPSQFYSWYDAPSGGNLIGYGTALTQTPTTPGTYTYYVQVNDVNCSNPVRVATSAFTILPKPTVTASADVTICENNSTSLSASGSATGFTWNPGALIGNPVNVTPSSTIIYTVTGTDANGCTNNDDVIVYVTPVPTLGTASANPPFICLGNSTSLSYTPPAGLSCNGAYQTFFGGAYAPANWTTTQTNSNGSVNTTSAPTSISLISSNNGSGVTGTLSYSIPISCSGVVSFQWSYSTVDGSFYDYPMYSVNGGSSNLFPGYILLPNTTIQSGFFQLLVNAGDVLSLNCYSLDNVAGSCTVDITNFSAPTQTASVQSVTWFNAPSGGTNLGNTNPLTVVPTTAGSFTFYAAVTNALGCSNPLRVATNAVTVSSLPVANAGVDKTLTCTTPSATLGTAAVGGNTYSWNPATGLSSASSATPTCSATVTTTYTLTVTNASGCVATDVVTVTVNKTAPTANAGSAVTLTCTSPSATLGTAAIGGNTYLWSPATALSASNVAQPTCSATATTTYTVTVTGSNGCTATSSVLVTVNKSAPTANAGSAITLTCTTPSATIGTVAVGGNTYLWSPATALSASNVAQPTCSATATTTYTVTVTGSNGCTATSSVLVTVNKSAPTANAGSAITLTCTTPSATIGTVAVGGNSYLWNPATALSASNVAQPICSATATTIYTVTVTGSNGCTATSTILVTVNKTAPTVSTSATSTSVACGASTTISATGASTYAWQPGSLSGSSITVSPTITTTYTVTGTATNGCTGTATRLITVAPCGSTVNVKLFIEGYYISSSTMQPALLNQGAPGALASQSDTITVELHNTTPPYAAVASQKRILNTNGTSTGNFGVSGNYYIVVKHRNSLELWSAAPVAVSGTVSYDFSNLASKAYGSNQVQMQPGVFATYSGDINQDLSIDVFDYIEMDPEILSGAFGYYAEDVNGDGSVDVFDYLVVDPNITNGVGAATP